MMRESPRDYIAEKNRSTRRAQILKKVRELMEDERFQMDDFVDLYGASAFKADIARVERLKKTFAENDKRHPEKKEVKDLANILEAIIADQIYDSYWFGENVEARPTSEYDDFVNGIDLVTIFDVEGKAKSHIGLAIDVTFSSYPGKKVKRIYDEIRTGRMPSIKYYEDDLTRGEIKQVPRALVAVSGGNVDRLSNIWVNEKNGLVDSPLKAQLADQIVLQLTKYRDFASSLGGPRDGIADLYDRQLRIFQDSVASVNMDEVRASQEAEKHFFDEDRAHRGLMRELQNTFA